MDCDNPFFCWRAVGINGAVGRAVEEIDRTDQAFNGWIAQVKPEIFQNQTGNPERSDPKKGINLRVL
jgi:hypothetical protein